MINEVYADYYFRQARIKERNCEYEEAIRLFSLSKEHYIKLKSGKMLIALECALNITLNKIQSENVRPSQPGHESYLSATKFLIEDLKKSYKRAKPLLKSKKMKRDFFSACVQIFRIMSQKLSDAGMEKLADEMLIKALDFKNTVRKWDDNPKNFFIKWFKKGIEPIRGLSKIYNYGLDVWKLVWVSIIIIAIAAFLFYIPSFSYERFPLGDDALQDGIIYQGDKKRFAKGLECIYVSIVTFTNLGTEEFWPVGSLMKTFVVLESILGYLVLSLLVAHFVRRIK